MDKNKKVVPITTDSASAVVGRTLCNRIIDKILAGKQKDALSDVETLKHLIKKNLV